MRALLGVSLGFCVCVAACGGSSTSEDGSAAGGGGSTGGLGGGVTGGSGGGVTGGAGGVTGGAGGLGGSAGGAGQAGAPCVTSQPGAYPLCETPAGAPCNSPGYFCVLNSACSGGYLSELMECTANESGAMSWQLPPYCCDKPYNVCAITDVTCLNGSTVYENGDSPTEGCPLDRPAVGDSCTPGANGAPTCGYPCPAGGGWSVAKCESVGKQDAFLLDGACAGDCSKELAALGDFVQQSSKCNTAADCNILYSACPPIAEHCSGAVYLNTSADPGQWNAVSQAYDSCHAGGGFGCAVCEALPPPPACKDGVCVPGP